MNRPNTPFPSIWYQPTLEGGAPRIITVQCNVTLYVPQKIVKDVFIARDALGNRELLRTGSSQVPIFEWLSAGPDRLSKVVEALRDITQGMHEPF